MKKAIKILLMTAFVLSLLCVTAMAADNTSDGFYNIEAETGVTLTPYIGAGASATEATATQKDVDGDATADTWYENSDRIEVSYSGAVSGKEYGVILVKGTGLPTVNDNICFIDQVTATSTTVDFNVYPILPDETTDMTLYISSNATGFELKDIPVSYAVGVAGEEPTPTILYGDATGDGNINSFDALRIKQYVGDKVGTTIDLVAADATGDGNVNSFDALRVKQYVGDKSTPLGPQS